MKVGDEREQRGEIAQKELGQQLGAKHSRLGDSGSCGGIGREQGEKRKYDLVKHELKSRKRDREVRAYHDLEQERVHAQAKRGNHDVS